MKELQGSLRVDDSRGRVYIPGLDRGAQEIFKALPYVVTIIVLVFTSLRKKREYQPPASLGLAYFREER